MTLSLLDKPVSTQLLVLINKAPSLESLRGKRLLLTGGTGFFGRWLLLLLAVLNEQGYGIKVTVVSRDPARFLALEPAYQGVFWLKWCVGDVRSVTLPAEHFDMVLHAATDTSGAAHEDGLKIFDTIVEGSRRVLEWSATAGVERVLLVGSGAQYGVQPDEVSHIREEASLACDSALPSSAYGEAKRAVETMAALYALRYGFEVVYARCFAFAGPGLPIDAHFAIGNFVRDALYASQITVRSGGTALRSYLYGADLALWLLGLLLHGENARAYNVGSDTAVSIADLAHLVVKVLAPDKSVQVQGCDTGPRQRYVPDISWVRALGLEVWTDLETAILAHGEWLRRYKA